MQQRPPEHPLSVIGRQITDDVIEPVGLQIGKSYIHPEHGKITITRGCYRDPTFGRISNHWHWTVRQTGETGHGYGANWPPAPD
jgi:hypothetical protein